MTTKYNKYNDMGKARKANHYQRLLLLNPPMPKGHKVSRACAALRCAELTERDLS